MKNIGLILSVFLLYSCGEAPLRFERLESEKTGISFSNDLTETDSFNILKNEYIYNGGGVGVADFNADGLQDLVFVGNHVSTRFYLNKGNLRFEDISDRFDGLTNDQWYSGVSVTDINGDDLPDFYLTSTMSKIGEQRKNKFWVNQGLDSDGLPTYREMAEDYAIADTGYSVHSVFFDYDLDGDLDLYVLNNILNKMVPTNYRPKITDGSSINNDRLYQNTGNGKFIDVTIPAGIVYEGYGLGLAVGDVNKDGYPDLYISNDYASNDLLYINQGDGTFQNESASYLSYQSKFSMGNDISDYNNDGNPDIITVDMLPEAYFRKKQTINGNSYIFYINDEKYGYEHQYTRNMIHRHNGFGGEQMLPFSEIGQLLGVYQTEWSWSPLFADFDNDGDRDLFITNGFPKDLTDKDFTNYQAQVGGFVASDAHMLSRIPVVKVSNYAYESKDGNSFEDKTEAWGMKIPSFSNGASFVDLDNDGDLDYVVNNINEPAFIYRNNTIGGLKDAAHYIRLKLKGSSFNTLAIGARVEIWVDGHYQFMEQSLSRGYISSVEPIVHFGLKSGNPIDSIRVLWPGNKRVTLLKEVMPNQLLAVNEADAQSFEGRIKPENKPAFFTSVQDVLDYTHSEIDYIDFFQNQNILPHKYSQIGPCMAKGDIDNDGKDDLIIGASSDLPTQVFLWRENGFVNTQFSGLTDRKQCQESDLVFVDIDQDGDQDIVSLAGGYTNEKAEEYRHFVYLNKGGSFSKMEINIPPFPASVVRAADVDQ
ncbi:MAG: CRTAC1 family protein, partial [Cyclobacteriaceae bacterium]|nr:CRTAC1 family protein [Cyclobacteriaceae bacterium]